jgi:hypothetical protein
MEGMTTRFRRARPYAPATGELQTFAGRYRSDEAGSVFRVAPEGAGLGVSLEHAPEKVQRFMPVDTDTFQAGGMMVRLQRDTNGNVVGLDYSNPLVRNLRFERLGDGADCHQ